MKQNKFWIEPIAGLGNRMQVLASAYYLAHKHQKQLSVLWNNNEDLGADFKDIFKTDTCHSLSFHGSCYNALDDVFLTRKIENNNRNN